ncbi:NADH-quinone oxidoreductase subunit NuoK [Candidatus Hikarchaeum yamanae]|jgi:NADH-quinone oxidoreductase subunit K|uniref:NADH-quinone oxidoreductase subunit NuoK n=1 Tax=Candidatus Hikarchaeum yamanae TaxID=2675326 RepID=UPI0039EA4FED
MVPISYYILLSAAIFSIGLFGVLTRRNALMFLISIELMLNAANLNFVAFSALHGNLTGQVFSLFILALAAAEVAVGIGIILVLYKNFSGIDVTKAVTLRW